MNLSPSTDVRELRASLGPRDRLLSADSTP
uniref:Uncharacterized protein n=1 Tax=Anguilla anguilla TaxID=7936 RepID=A0A0E9R0X7_ANGAN